MDAEVTKKPDENFKTAIGFWSKQVTNDLQFVPKPSDVGSHAPPQTAPKPVRNVALLKDARSTPPNVAPKPKKRDATSAPPAIKQRESVFLHRLGGQKEKPSRQLELDETVVEGTPEADLSNTQKENEEGSSHISNLNPLKNVLKKISDSIVQPHPIPKGDKSVQFLKHAEKKASDDTSVADIKEPKPISIDEDSNISNDVDIITGEWGASGFLPKREPGPMKDRTKTKGRTPSTKLWSENLNSSADETIINDDTLDTEESSICSELDENPSTENLDPSSEDVGKASAVKELDAASSVLDGLETLSFSQAEMDSSPNIKEYEEKLKDSFRKARLRKASPKLKRKNIGSNATCETPKQTLPVHQVPNERSALLDAQKLWESCLKDDRGVKPREYGTKYLERDSARQLITPSKPPVTEWHQRENRMKQDVESISNRISYFDATTRSPESSPKVNFVQNMTKRLETKDTIKPNVNRFENGSASFSLFQKRKDETDKELDESTKASEPASISDSKETTRKPEHQIKLIPGLENRGFVKPTQKESSFQPLPVRFSPLPGSERPQPRWHFIDALSIPPGEDASTSSSADSNLPSTSNSGQTSYPTEANAPGNSSGHRNSTDDEDHRRVRQDSSTENVADDEAGADDVTEEAEAMISEGANSRQRPHSNIADASRALCLTRRSKRKHQRSKSHRKSSQPPNGGHRQLKRSRSLENLYKLYHHLVVSRFRRFRGEDEDALYQSAGDNVLEETQPQRPRPPRVRRQRAQPFSFRRHLMMNLFILLCLVLGLYTVLMASMSGIVTQNDFTYDDLSDDYWK